MRTNWIDAITKALGVEPKRLVSAEERKTFRIDCDMPVKIDLRQSKTPRTCSGQLINVSTGGVKVRLAEMVRKDEPADVVLIRTRAKTGMSEVRVHARVVWCKKRGDGYDAGLQFVSFGEFRPADVMNLIRQEVPSVASDDRQKRRSQRLACNLPVTYTLPDGTSAEGIAKNISRRGILIDASQPVKMGTKLTLSITVAAKGAPPVCGQGLVKRCTMSEVGDSFEIACFTEHMSIGDRTRLEDALQGLRRHKG